MATQPPLQSEIDGWQCIPAFQGEDVISTVASDDDLQELASRTTSDAEEHELASPVGSDGEGHELASRTTCPRSKLLNRLGLSLEKETNTSPKPRKTHCTCIIFDFDDTLFCTSHIYNGIRQPPEPAELRKLDFQVARILTRALSLGTTKIVTNAQGGWAESMTKKHLPESYKLLDRIEVISARDKFEKRHPNDPVTWKVEAFCAIKENSRIIANLTAIGDSKAEMVAIKEMAKLYRISFFKAIRMKENPSCSDLQKQLRTLEERFDTIVNAAKNYDISLKARPVPAS